MENTTTSNWDGSLLTEAVSAMQRVRSDLRMQYLDSLVDPHRELSEAHWAAYAERTERASKVVRDRDWFLELTRRFELHPVVRYLVSRYRPHDWQQLLFEWPHISQTDPMRLAYTRDERAGREDRQTITSIGKYIKRHWPRLADHTLRDAQALFKPERIEHKVGDVRDYIVAVELGPRSCMQGGYGSIPFRDTDHQRMLAWLKDRSNGEPNWSRHPYFVYEPDFGWGMVTRISGDGTVMGRCLTWTDPDDSSRKVFVRSYQQRNSAGDASSSGSDHAIEAWLTEQGYAKESEWPEGARFAATEHPTKSGDMMPYLDGSDSQARRVRSDHLEGFGAVYVRDDSGVYTCDNTDGTLTQDHDDDEDMVSCEECGESVHYEDTYCVGRHDDISVCEYCSEHEYTLVRGAYNSRTGDRWRNYRVRNSDAAPVYESFVYMRRGNELFHIDTDNVPDGVIQLEDGEYADLDYAVCCTDGEYRFSDDPDVVELAECCPETGESYAVIADAWKDHEGNWYSEHAEHIEYEGQLYLKDNCWECPETGQWYPDHVDAPPAPQDNPESPAQVELFAIAA